MANGIPQFGWASGPPIDPSVFYPQGSILRNNAPVEGGAQEWVCVQSGNPGTWVVGSRLNSSDGKTLYLGDGSTDGSWRLTVSGSDLIVQYRTGGAWVDKGLFEPA